MTGTFTFGPGHLPIELASLEPGPPTKIHMIGARAKVTGVSATGVMTAIVAGAITQDDLDSMILPQWQQNATDVVLRDCCGAATSPGGATCNPSGTPPCGCVDGSTRKTLIGLLDTSPKDCTITLTEIQNNALFMSLLAPDVTIEGKQALSFGMQVTAVPASIKS